MAFLMPVITGQRYSTLTVLRLVTNIWQWIQRWETFLLYFNKDTDGCLSGIMGLYVDDSTAAGNREFESFSTRTDQIFYSKQRENATFVFAGIKIDNDNSV